MMRRLALLWALLAMITACSAQQNKQTKRTAQTRQLYDVYFGGRQTPITTDALPQPDTTKPVRILDSGWYFPFEGTELRDNRFIYEDDYRIRIRPPLPKRVEVRFDFTIDAFCIVVYEEEDIYGYNYGVPTICAILDKPVTSKEDLVGTYYVTWRVMPNGRDVYPALTPE